MTRRVMAPFHAAVPVAVAVALAVSTASVTRPPAGPRVVPLGDQVEDLLDTLGISVGPWQAPVVVRVIGDYECSACEELDRTVGRTLRGWAAQGRLRYQLIQSPLEAHRRATKASRALYCAADQGAAWPMHELLVARRPEWGWGADPAIAFARYARVLKLDPDRFVACLGGLSAPDRTRADREGASSVGVSAVPVIIVGHRLIQPRRSFTEVLAYVEPMLARSVGGIPGPFAAKERAARTSIPTHR